jgi:hypothetical protein
VALGADFIRDAGSGYPYRSSQVDRVINDFSASASGPNTYSPQLSGDRVVIVSFLVSTDTACTVTLAGDMSDPINFYFGHRGGVSMQLSQYAPIVGEVGETFSVSCDFTGGTGKCSSVIFGYEEKQVNEWS